MSEEVKGQPVQADDAVVSDGKVFAIVAYIGILCLLPLLLKKDNKFALHHGKQGLVLFIGGIASGIIGIVPVIGWILLPFLMLTFMILSVIGIIQAISGKYWRAPVIADLADKINI